MIIRDLLGFLVAMLANSRTILYRDNLRPGFLRDFLLVLW